MVNDALAWTPQKAGYIKLKFIADSSNQIQESDESELSNVWSTTVVVR